MTKACFKCLRELPLSEFYRHPRMADGHLNKCKACAKQDVRANYAAKREQYLTYNRERHQTPARRQWLRDRIERVRREEPHKWAAWMAVRRAVASGAMTRQPCETCGDPRTDAHHTDYSKPLDVTWLCRQHHMEAHHPREVAA